MPRKAQDGISKPSAKSANRQKAVAKNNCSPSESPGSADDPIDNESPLRSNPLHKRNATEMEDNDVDLGNQVDFGSEMSKILECFGADINKTLVAKRKRLEQYTQESMRSTTKKVLDTTKSQCEERRRIMEEFRRQLNCFIQQGEIELEKTKEAEEKLQKLIQQQQKHQQQIRISQTQRLRALKSLGEQFFKGIDELENRHIEQYSNVHNDLKKEMALLQKRILVDTQQREMMNVRKNLQSMLM